MKTVAAATAGIALVVALALAQSSGTKQPSGAGSPTKDAHVNEHQGEAALGKAVEATVTGSNFCLGCSLKKELGAGAQCSIYGHTHALRVTKALAGGKELSEMKGWVLHYLATDKSQDLINKHDGENLIVTGKVYPNERVLEVMSYEKAAEPEAKAKEPTWHTSLETALAEAGDRNTLILVDAYAVWCGWCDKLEKDTLSDADVQAKMRGFTLLKIDTDKQPEVARRYGVTGLPTTLILNAKGAVILRQAGYMPPKDYLELLARAQKHAS
jgi:thioredoxin-related protein